MLTSVQLHLAQEICMARKNTKKPQASTRGAAPQAPLTADFIIPGFPKCSTSAGLSP